MGTALWKCSLHFRSMLTCAPCYDTSGLWGSLPFLSRPRVVLPWLPSQSPSQGPRPPAALHCISRWPLLSVSGKRIWPAKCVRMTKSINTANLSIHCLSAEIASALQLVLNMGEAECASWAGLTGRKGGGSRTPQDPSSTFVFQVFALTDVKQ